MKTGTEENKREYVKARNHAEDGKIRSIDFRWRTEERHERTKKTFV